jgi:lipopolysaccharide biosynthesis regulator YciM
MKLEVASQIEQQMTEFMKTPESIPHRTYFEAAQYYSNNGKDLNEALDFIDKALEKSPENFRYGLLKAKIQAKNNDGEGALITVKIAYQWAKNKNNANYIEQTRLFWDSLLTKK